MGEPRLELLDPSAPEQEGAGEEHGSVERAVRVCGCVRVLQATGLAGWPAAWCEADGQGPKAPHLTPPPFFEDNAGRGSE